MIGRFLFKAAVALPAFLPCCDGSAQWTPTESSSPMEVLEEAQGDRLAGRFEDSLRKFEWLFKQGHIVDPAFDSVRVSFAIGGWADLAKDFAPARAKLHKLQNTARKSVLSSSPESVEAKFRDYDAINLALDEREDSVSAFKVLYSKSPDIAARALPAAKDALFDSREYRLLSEFIDPRQAFVVETKRFREMSAKARTNSDMQEFVEEQYRENVFDLIKMLVGLERREEAQEIANEAKETLPGTDFGASLSRSTTEKD